MAIIIEEKSQKDLTSAASLVFLNGFAYVCSNQGSSDGGVYRFPVDEEGNMSDSDLFVEIWGAQLITTDGTHLWVIGRLSTDESTIRRLFLVDINTFGVLGYSAETTGVVKAMACDTLGWCHLVWDSSTWRRYRWTGSELQYQDTGGFSNFSSLDVSGNRILTAQTASSGAATSLWIWDGITSPIGEGDSQRAGLIKFVNSDTFVSWLSTSPGNVRLFRIVDNEIVTLNKLFATGSIVGLWSDGSRLYFLMSDLIRVIGFDTEENMILVHEQPIAGFMPGSRQNIYATPKYIMVALTNKIMTFNYVLNAQYTATPGTIGIAPFEVTFEAF